MAPRDIALARADACVEFRNVSKSYDGKQLAVDNLSCRIRRGEFLTFLGPSGSGKTTALMMLAGFETPTSGEILLNGQSLARRPPHRRNMGVVFQNYALFPHMTVAENVRFPLAVRRLATVESRERVAQALELVQLRGLDKRRPAELSGGQQQRVALARALVFNPDVVLMDEPLGALDQRLREQLQLDIKRIQTELGITVVYVTHDQDEALRMSDRIAVFAQGRVLQLSSPRELYEEPASAFVAQFVGQNNQLQGVIVSAEADRCVVRTTHGVIVRARLAAAGRASDPTLLAIRPECIALGEPRQGTNVFEAVVKEAAYHGDHMRVQLALNEHESVVAKATQAPAGGWVVGARTILSWRAESCRAFPAETLEQREVAA
jgi:putative spermidine/putrescine transport system ATP-binding protein